MCYSTLERDDPATYKYTPLVLIPYSALRLTWHIVLCTE